MGWVKPRKIAFSTLQRIEDPGDFAEHRLEAEPGFLALRPDDRRLAQELIFGILRHRATLDWLTNRRTAGRVQRPAIRILLHLGLYQLLFLDRIPPHAAVHETVELARESGHGPESGFINAVLRTTLRDLPGTRAALVELRKTDPATATSHPAWLVDRWLARHGLTDTDRLLDHNNTPPPTFARVNTLTTNAEKLVQTWATEGVTAVPREFSWANAELVFELQRHPSLASLGSFQQGDFYIQDPSTLLAVGLLDPQPGERILDACSAPGGKTTFIAQTLQNRGLIVAEDTNPARLQLVSENVARLGTTCVEVRATDAPRPPGEWFDRVLVDAPCSNTGVLRRRIELRWRLKSAELLRLRDQQLQILDANALRVRPGGVLIYSTCSLEPEENTGVITTWLAGQSEFILESQSELTPWKDGVDGAFVAKMRHQGKFSRVPSASLRS